MSETRRKFNDDFREGAVRLVWEPVPGRAITPASGRRPGSLMPSSNPADRMVAVELGMMCSTVLRDVSQPDVAAPTP